MAEEKTYLELKKATIEIDRKILAELVVNQPEAFKALVEKAQSAN
jgi:large subunit ribosomal protein L20